MLSKYYAAGVQTCILFSRWTRQSQLWQGRPWWWPRCPWGSRAAGGPWSPWPSWPSRVLWASLLQDAGRTESREEHERALRVPMCVSISLHPAQTAEDRIVNEGEIKTQTNISTKVSVRYFWHSGCCTVFQKEYLATQAGTMVLTEIHRCCLLLSPFGGK